MLTAILILMFLSFLVFLRVYGPGLITAFIEAQNEKYRSQVMAEYGDPYDNIQQINRELEAAFGKRECALDSDEEITLLQLDVTVEDTWSGLLFDAKVFAERGE